MTDAEQPLDLVPLAGSEREEAPGLTSQVAIDPDALIDATLIIRRQAQVPDEVLSAPISRAEFASTYGASQRDLDLVTSTMESLGVTVVDSSAAERRVRVSGSARLMSRVFGTDLAQATSTGANDTEVTHRHRTGGLSIPATLDGVVTAVLGLDDRPQARALFRLAMPQAVTTSYTPLELGEIYKFPAGTDGSGQTIAIVELGGGYEQTDLDTYFSALGIKGPKVTAIGVDGAVNVPGGDPGGADGEVMLDIEVAGALAPAADILVYFAPNTDAGFVDAVAAAAHATPTPAVISISWGQSEDSWTQQARTAFDQALVDAAALGVTTTVAAGDDGSTDRVGDGKAHVDFPASSPHALACGGTRLSADVSTGAVRSETVWNNGTGAGATGGGVSATFPQPSWQAKVGVPIGPGGTDAGGPANGPSGRGVPDVAGVADPQTGYRVRVDGKDLVIGGTSAVAPLWAALIARIVQSTGKPLGLAQPALYDSIAKGQVAAGFRDITTGNNGAYQAGPGWDACTGLGVPDGTALLAAL
ncbi:MAG TPA: S53 family peptidase [Leifsonia sp.]|jgi:kumamolisin|nr:S53 family peptidase [Leifsonia sp.]